MGNDGACWSHRSTSISHHDKEYKFLKDSDGILSGSRNTSSSVVVDCCCCWRKMVSPGVSSFFTVEIRFFVISDSTSESHTLFITHQMLESQPIIEVLCDDKKMVAFPSSLFSSRRFSWTTCRSGSQGKHYDGESHLLKPDASKKYGVEVSSLTNVAKLQVPRIQTSMPFICRRFCVLWVWWFLVHGRFKNVRRTDSPMRHDSSSIFEHQRSNTQVRADSNLTADVQHWTRSLIDHISQIAHLVHHCHHILFFTSQRVEALKSSGLWRSKKDTAIQRNRHRNSCSISIGLLTNLRDSECKAICLLKNSDCLEVWCDHGRMMRCVSSTLDVSSTKTSPRSIAQVHDGGMLYNQIWNTVQNLDKNYQKVRRPVPFSWSRNGQP